VRTVPVVVPLAAFAERTRAPSGVAAWPNPFRDFVRLDVRDAGRGSVELFDVAGRIVRRAAARDGVVLWDGRDEEGRVAPAGVYFARWVDTEGRSRTLRLVRAR
jgi:hypothetical protein